MISEIVRRLWKSYRAQIQIGFAAIGVALAVGIPFGQERLCSVQKHVDEPATYRITIDHPASHQADAPGVTPPLTTFSFGPSINGGINEVEHTEASYYAAKEEEDWGRRYVCDVTATDYFLVLFTLVLAIATVRLWNSTKGLYDETKRLATGADDQAEKMERSVRQQRRAAFASLVSAKAAKTAAAAAVQQATVAVSVELPILRAVSASTSNDASYDKEQWIDKFLATVQVKNFGRTTAFVHEAIINAEFTGWSDDPAYEPIYTKLDKYPTMTAIPHGETAPFVSFYVRKNFTAEQIAGFIKAENFLLYGILHFKDFMGNPHTQGFAFLWVPANKRFMEMHFASAYNKQT